VHVFDNETGARLSGSSTSSTSSTGSHAV